MKSSILVLVVLIVLVLGWIRFSPTDVDDWHLDPGEIEDPGATGFRLIGREAPRFPGDPDTILSELVEIARSEPRTRILDGSVDEGMITFVSRTAFLGLRDYTTIKAVAEGAEVKLSLAARARYRFGTDWGTNRDRLDRWLTELLDRIEG